MNAETNAVEEQIEEVAEEMTLQTVARKSFGPDALNDAQTYIGDVMKACEVSNVEPIFNFDPAENLPEGYGLSVIPLTERITGQGNVTKGVCIAAVPSLDKIMSEASGQTFVQNAIVKLMINSVKAAASPGADGAISSLPFKVLDFTTSSRSSALAAFNAVASLYVKALKDKGLKFMSKTILRQVLSSAGFAEQQFPHIEQDNWQIVLKSMVAHAAKEGQPAGILSHWSKTRDAVEVDTTEIDLSDIDGMV